MARWLKQSTSVDVPIGPFLASSDGFTASTALTITQPDIRLKKNGGAWAQKAAAQTLSHEENGYYEVTLDATDTNTLGLLRLAVNETGALPVWEDFEIVTANIWDSHFGADLLDVSLVQIAGDAQSGTDLKDFADAGYDPATNKVEGVKLADTVTTYTGNSLQTGDSFARIGATGSGLTSLATQASVNTIDGIVDDILLDTAEIGAAGAGLTNINLPNQTMDIVGDITGNLSGSVGSVTGAVGSVTGAVGSVTGAVGSVTGAVGSVTGNVGGNVTGSVGSVATGGITAASLAADAITAAKVAADVGTEIADAVLDRAIAEPSAIFTWPASLRLVIGFAGAAWRNKRLTTATLDTIRNDADSGNITTAVLADDGDTLTRSEYT